jgi:hypothetical protein
MGDKFGYKKYIDNVYRNICDRITDSSNKLKSLNNYIVDYPNDHPFFINKINKSLYKEDEAINNLFKRQYVCELSKKLFSNNIDSLIAGIIVLGSIIKASYYCNHSKVINLYLKNVNTEKIMKVDKIIKSMFPPDYKIIIVKDILTISWIIFNSSDDLELKIEVNTLQLNNWDELFITFHSSIICVGYSILDKKIILQQRWFMNLTSNKYLYLDGNFNFDTSSTLKLAKRDYERLGFECKMINYESNDKLFGDKKKDGLWFWCEDKIIKYLLKNYGSNDNVCFLSDIEDIGNMFNPLKLNDISIYSYKDLINLKDGGELFLKYPIMLNQQMEENKKILIKNKFCCHKITLHDYICATKYEMLTCPSYDNDCFKIFEPILIYNCIRPIYISI